MSEAPYVNHFYYLKDAYRFVKSLENEGYTWVMYPGAAEESTDSEGNTELRPLYVVTWGGSDDFSA